MFASFLPVGSVTWLYYTDRLTDFPLGVFGVAIATVILPNLSRKHANHEQHKFSETLDWGLRMILLIGFPAAIGLAIFSMPLVATCFGYGQFLVIDVLQTQKSIMTLGLGVPAFMVIKVLASGFYSKQNIKTPVKIGALAMLVNSILCALLVYPLKHAGLALASSLAGYFNAFCLFYLLKKHDIYHVQPGWAKFLWQLLCANGIMGCYLCWVQGDLSDWYHINMGLRLLTLIGHVIAAIMLYLIGLLITGFKWRQFRGLGGT